jgi:mRNA-degrading endonuclease toxin of MazEF toxin-antitoxin module
MDATASASDPSSPRSRQLLPRIDATMASDPSPLRGPRPPRLAVTRESHKIKKPTAITPQPNKSHHLQQPPARSRFIIYDASPKLIDVEPADFKALVQRLTGPVATAPPDSSMEMQYAGRRPVVVSSPPPVQPSRTAGVVVSASGGRLAATARAVGAALPLALRRPPADSLVAVAADADRSLAAVLSLPRRPPGILSPSPAALPPAACSGQFSATPFDPSCLPWLKDKELSLQSPFFLRCRWRRGAAMPVHAEPTHPPAPRHRHASMSGHRSLDAS